LQIYDGRESFYQWDLNQKVTSDEFEVGDKIHFFNMRQTNALVVRAYELDGVVVADVPNILLQTALPITAWKYVYDEHSAQTVMEDTFKVEQRPQPYDYFYSETELYELRKEVADVVSQLDGIAEAEDERAANESDRIVAEVERENAEEDRVDAESIRVENENARNNAESNRVIAEQSRVEAETNRASAEQERIAAEEVRQANFETSQNNVGNAVKGYASGEVVRVDDVSPIEHTAKVNVSGKNLLNHKAQSQTINGITFTVNDDGTVTANGTATENAVFILSGRRLTVPAGTYTLSGCDIGGSHSTYAMACTEIGIDYGNGITKTFAQPTYLETFYPVIYKGATVNNVVFKPMLELGDTATKYEPYIDPTTVTVTRYGTDETDNLQTYIPSADGTCEFKALSPTMTLVTDNPKVTIDLEYNQDTNKALENVKSDIRSLDDAVAELSSGGAISQGKVSLLDAATGKSYRLYVSNGKLMLAESEG
jgi:hypothetical protein